MFTRNKGMNVFTQVLSRMSVLHVERCSRVMAMLECINVFTQVLSCMHVLLVERCSHDRPVLGFMNISTQSRDLFYVVDVHTIVPERFIELIHTRVPP